MPIQPGDRIPEAVLQYIDDGVRKINAAELFAHRRMVLFAVPGAFTPTCSQRHLPGYVEHFDAFKQRGIEVACMAVNDPFVMQAWGKDQHVPTGLRLLADGNGDFTRALGMTFDASGYGMGIRSKRFALYADDGIVRGLWVEAPGELRVSAADAVLARLSA
ncbi:peroxiredoxin [Thermomonas sp.]|uniref:peroxiredoxin n=1 Tax=Thermomonas sp. TaxID=1971895 RepID=UPI002605B9BC|nr:peroxiredoxin [Thermomonas sp.]MCO5054040.1 peroxiredoxin [Thermomonas sp.]